MVLLERGGGGGSGATGSIERARAAHPGVQILPEVCVGLASLGLLRRGRGGGGGRCAALASDCAGDGDEARGRRAGNGLIASCRRDGQSCPHPSAARAREGGRGRALCDVL